MLAAQRTALAELVSDDVASKLLGDGRPMCYVSLPDSAAVVRLGEQSGGDLAGRVRQPVPGGGSAAGVIVAGASRSRTDLSTSPITASVTCPVVKSLPHTASAAARSKLPANTDRRVDTVRSTGVQRDWLHSIDC